MNIAIYLPPGKVDFLNPWSTMIVPRLRVKKVNLLPGGRYVVFLPANGQKREKTVNLGQKLSSREHRRLHTFRNKILKL